MTRNIGLVAAQSKPEAAALAADIAPWLRARGATVVPETALRRHAAADIIVVLGGDGLMMRAANTFPDIPLLGINFGKVGFLAATERRDWQAALSAVIEGHYAVHEGPTLAATLGRGGDELDQGWAINDVVIRAGYRMVDVELYIDSHYVNTYPGDGIIVSTPQGSTAYGMAAGGPILIAGVRGFAIVPISCHSPIRTPLVAPEEALIEILNVNNHEASLILDGRPTTKLRDRDLIKVARGSHVLRLVTLDSTDFFQAFRTKFNFQIRPDAVPSRRS